MIDWGFDDVLAWLSGLAGATVNALLALPDGSVLALLTGRLGPAETLSETPDEPLRVGYSVGDGESYFVLDASTFERVGTVGFASLNVRCATTQLWLEPETAA